MELLTEAAGNNNAAAMLKRDMANFTAQFSRFAPALAATRFGEIWSLYETAALRSDTVLTGRVETSVRPADVDAVRREISDVRAEHEARQRHRAMLDERRSSGRSRAPATSTGPT